uniref:Uncharacterized protein n=1 Tax=Knipowitschia caucasica TaxID=637954 RepID=A0AAV2JZ12_KNICA
MWSEDGKAKAAKASFRPKNNKFRVEEPELHLGPYESHLQMFVWKEMIQVVLASGRSTSLKVKTKPQKVGLYLNCLRKELSFYNADTMELMHTATFSSSLPVCVHFSLGKRRHNPLVIYKY